MRPGEHCQGGGSQTSALRFWSVCPGRGPRICISNRFLADVHGAGESHFVNCRSVAWQWRWRGEDNGEGKEGVQSTGWMMMLLTKMGMKRFFVFCL